MIGRYIIINNAIRLNELIVGDKTSEISFNKSGREHNCSTEILDCLKAICCGLLRIYKSFREAL